MKNLFVVVTPFHLMTSFILMKSIFADDENYLALLHPHGYDRWQDEKLMNYLASKDAGYKAVYPLIKWFKTGSGSYAKQADDVKKELGAVGFDQLFLGGDYELQTQMLVAALGKTSFYRIEDGLNSYTNSNPCRPWYHALFHLLKMHIIKMRAGIKSDLKFNTKCFACSEAATRDYMYKPEIMTRKSPCPIAIEKMMVKQAVEDLSAHNLLKPVFTEDTVIYLSQPLVEQGRLKQETELNALRLMLKTIKPGTKFLFKPHPNDKREKIDEYKKALPELTVYDSKVPVEFLYAAEPNLKAIVSYQSSALMFRNIFTDADIKMISLAEIYGNSLQKEYFQVMAKAGVVFPTSEAELQDLLAQIS